MNEKAAHPIHKATIIPRGRALGMVMQLPERDELSQTREQLHAQMAIAMGGRVAEEIIFGHDKVTTGASSDIEQATKRARAMVMRAGLSKELGPVLYGENEEEVFLGREKILKVHAKKISMAPDVNLRTVARGTPGFSGADLANLVNESALLAARKNKRVVTNQEFEEAKDKVMMGSERRSMVMTEEEKN